jgi:hypothetical protein
MEIGGSYLIWQWFKEDRSLWYGVSGAILHALYGVAATYQTAGFGRVYATYGGVFIILYQVPTCDALDGYSSLYSIIFLYTVVNPMLSNRAASTLFPLVKLRTR